MESADPELWSNYLDDLQRLLGFIIDRVEGNAFRRWMEENEYPMHYAPLYNALVASIEGADHLLRINPEMREPAERIYQGIAHRVKIYSKSKSK